MENKLELRMYGLVPYNISPIQQGIQYGHSKDEYTLAIFDLLEVTDESGFNWGGYPIESRSSLINQYKDWLRNWKTYIILNGGTTNTNVDRLGTLNKHLQTLRDNGIFCSVFHEPDLGDQLTGVDFIVDERVFNREKYPDFDLKPFYGDKRLDYNEIYLDPLNPNFPNYINTLGSNVKVEWNKWVESIGGRKNLFLRGFLKNFRLA